MSTVRSTLDVPTRGGGGTAGATARAQSEALFKGWVLAFNTQLASRFAGDSRVVVVDRELGHVLGGDDRGVVLLQSLRLIGLGASKDDLLAIGAPGGIRLDILRIVRAGQGGSTSGVDSSTSSQTQTQTQTGKNSGGGSSVPPPPPPPIYYARCVGY